MAKSKVEIRGLEKIGIEAAVDKVRQARRAVLEAEAQATIAVKFLAEAHGITLPDGDKFGWIAVPNADKSGLEAIEFLTPDAKPEKVIPGPGSAAAGPKKKGTK